MPDRPTGAQLIARALAETGVRRVFSLSGNQVLSLYDALDREGIAIVHTRHEGAAVHMADAWARLTGEVGVCLVTAGPGHANALGALAMAESGESPLVLLSGHAPVARPGGETRRGAFQAMDQAALARPVTRWAAVAREASHLPALLAQGLAHARSGRPGPVQLSLPVNVLEAPVEDAAPPGAPGAAAPSRPDVDAIGAIAARLHRAARPLVLTGPSGARLALHDPLRRFSALTRVPVVVVDHPRGLADPALGHAAAVVGRADTVLLLGARQDYRIAYGAALAPDCCVLQIDPDPEEVGRYRAAEVGVVADLGPAATHLLAAAQTLAPAQWPEARWAAEVAAAIAAPHAPPLSTDGDAAGGPDRSDRPAGAGELHPWRVLDTLAHVLDERERRGLETCLVVDGGEFGQWARARLAERLRRGAPHHLVNEPSGAIGYAVPFAVAAKLARPAATVVALAGDGAFGFYALELETAARLGAGLLVVVGNDGKWGTEYHLQRTRYGADRAVATDLLPARYDRLAEGLGGSGELVERADALRPALLRALVTADSGRPALINARIAAVPSPAGAPP